jgi:hypothetical protein
MLLLLLMVIKNVCIPSCRVCNQLFIQFHTATLLLIMKRAHIYIVNRIPAIRVFAVRVTLIFTNKIHALNTLKMGLLLRINVMLPQGVSGYRSPFNLNR